MQCTGKKKVLFSLPKKFLFPIPYWGASRNFCVFFETFLATMLKMVRYISPAAIFPQFFAPECACFFLFSAYEKLLEKFVYGKKRTTVEMQLKKWTKFHSNNRIRYPNYFTFGKLKFSKESFLVFVGFGLLPRFSFAAPI